MSLPALQALRREYPAAHIAVLARPWVAALYQRESFCDELIPYERASGWEAFLSRTTIARRLRTERFDCAVLLPNAFDAAFISWLARIPLRVGYRRDGRGILLTHSVPFPNKEDLPRHQRFQYLHLLKQAGLITSYEETAPIRLEGASAAAREGRKQLSAAGLNGSIVGVSPGAAFGGAKRWLPDRFAQAAVQVARELNASVAVFGSKQEHDICEQVERAVSSSGVLAKSFAGGTALGEFIEMAAACEAYLTNDSGPMHIASALGVRTVAVFGATDYQATGPTGDSARVVYRPVECSPCLLRECPIDHRCMTGVSANLVASEALNLVKLNT